MIFTLCHKVRLVRFFGRTVVAKPFGLSVNGHAGPPFILKPNHAHKSGFISSVWFANVLRVSIRKHIAKVFDSIVSFNAVNVVDDPFGPFAINVQPCQSMGFVNVFGNSNRNVANSLFHAPSYVPSPNSFAGANFPRKNAGVSVIIKRSFQFFYGQRHVNSPVVGLNIIPLTTVLQT